MKQDLKSTVKRMAWAYVFIYIDINLGTIDILPGWAGYMMIFSGLNHLSVYDKSSLLLKNPCVILTVYEIIKWLGKALGANYAVLGLLPLSLIRMVYIIIGVISIYFHFQLLTDLANVAGINGLEERKNILLRRRTLNTVLQTAVSASSILLNELLISDNATTFIAIILVVIGFIVVVSIASCLFALSRELGAEPEPAEDCL